MESQLQQYMNSDDRYERVDGVPMRSGIAGCMHGHFKAIKHAYEVAVERGYPYFAVCEDNFEFVAPIDWEGLVRDAPEDWVVLQLQSSNPGISCQTVKYVPTKKSHWGAKIYLVKTSECPKLIDYIAGDPRRQHRDADQVVYEGVKSYTMLKPVGLIKQFPSTIAGWHKRFTDKFLGKFNATNLSEHKYWLPLEQREEALSGC